MHLGGHGQVCRDVKIWIVRQTVVTCKCLLKDLQAFMPSTQHNKCQMTSLDHKLICF